jgi:DNA-binding NtrC family response regulator
LKLLLIEDDDAVRRPLARGLAQAGYTVLEAANLAEAQAKAESGEPDVVVSDIYLPDGSGIDLLPKLLALRPGLPVVMMTGAQDVATAVQAMRRGAEDYLTKPFELEELKLALDRAVERAGLRREVHSLRESLKASESQDHHFLQDPSMQKVYGLVEQVAALDKVTALILGETGTGKQHIARLIHRLSARSSKPFVELHCAALPETLLESELFGYEAGAFTDAKGRKKGLFEAAQGGTVFLDEVGELPLATQTKLLKVLEQKTVRRLGGLDTIQLDVRLVAATNRDLEAEVKAGRFRADLYYRLNVTRIDLPPLRQRPDDVEALVLHFFKEACTEFGKALPLPSADLLKALRALPWPGNVRELKNAVERMVIHANGPLTLASLPAEYAQQRREAAVAKAVQSAPSVGPAPAGLSPAEETEREQILALLEKLRWNKAQAARDFGVSKPTFFKRLHKYGLMDK